MSEMTSERRESFRLLTIGLIAALTVAIGIFGGIHGYQVLHAKPITAAWFVIGLAGIAICFVKTIQHKDNEDIVPKLFLTIFAFVACIGWLLR